MKGVEIYPDWLRYVAVDVAGRSRPTQFLLAVPGCLQGNRGVAELAVLNGATLKFRKPFDITIA